MRSGVPFDRLAETVGAIHHGEPFTLSTEDSELFHRATWLDRAYPDGDPDEFPEGIVEGFFLLSMLDAVARFAGAAADEASTWGLNYGLDKVRFISPVRLGDSITPSFETLEVVPKDAGYKILRRCTFRVDGRTEPAMVADWWTYAMPRGADPAAGQQE